MPAQNGGVGDTADSVAASLGGIVEAQQKALAERDETIAELAGDVRRLSRRMADPAAERDRAEADARRLRERLSQVERRLTSPRRYRRPALRG